MSVPSAGLPCRRCGPCASWQHPGLGRRGPCLARPLGVLFMQTPWGAALLLGWSTTGEAVAAAVLTSCLHVSFSLQASGCTWQGAACPASR